MVKQVICFPYAGGSSSIYFDWNSKLKGDVDIQSIEYPGHGIRYGEAFKDTIKEIADDSVSQVQRNAKDGYIMYGHSMGSLVALETIFNLADIGAKLPKALVVAASAPPHLLSGSEIDLKDKNAIMQFVFKLGQTESAVFEIKEIYDMFSEIIYADMRLVSEYSRSYSNGKLDIPVIAVVGDDDPVVSKQDMNGWGEYTTNMFVEKSFKGDHFFAFNNHEFLDYLVFTVLKNY